MKDKEKKTGITVRSSAAEYLTYVAAIGDRQESYEMRYEDENIWLTQKMMAALYDVTVQNIGQHIKKVFSDAELNPDSVVKKYFITATDGKPYETMHYSLQMIIAVGFKVNNERAVQFRKWANKIVKDYTIQGWAMDVERLKNGGTILTQDYFERQLEKIREIRLSERRFYQKITDIYATALDYDPRAKTTQEFFQRVQAKLHYAVHGQTPSEILYHRADAEKEYMGLTTWRDAPHGKIAKSDVIIAKNYLSEKEIHSLELIVSAYLDLAVRKAMAHMPMTMQDWVRHLDRILTADGNKLLTDGGSIAEEIAKERAVCEFEKYRIIQDRLFESDYDRFLRQLELLEEKSKDSESEILK